MVKHRSKTPQHEVKAYAAFDTRGNLLYATIKPTREDAEEALRRFNPPVSGHSYDFHVLPVSVISDFAFQFDLEAAIARDYAAEVIKSNQAKK